MSQQSSRTGHMVHLNNTKALFHKTVQAQIAQHIKVMLTRRGLLERFTGMVYYYGLQGKLTKKDYECLLGWFTQTLY